MQDSPRKIRIHVHLKEGDNNKRPWVVSNGLTHFNAQNLDIGVRCWSLNNFNKKDRTRYQIECVGVMRLDGDTVRITEK